jgi:uncharacterized protein
MSTFVDTPIWYAAVDSSDRGNVRAISVLKSEEDLVTTDHVLIETWMLIDRRIRRVVAEQFWENLREGAVVVEPVGSADLESAWQIGVAWKDQDFSIVDRTSFAVMRRLGIDRVASFDDHFAVFRFGPQRRQAFTVLR